MKKDHPCITLLGNNSGRNLGDATILSSILDVLSENLPDAEFLVPSITPRFIQDSYGSSYNVKGVNVMPWTGSIRLAGLPTIRCLQQSDIALICDGIIFGRRLFSPHNFLITLIFLLPFARLFRCRLVCFSCGIGPFPSRLSRLLARWLINACDLVIMREHDSAELAREIGVIRPIEVTGDAAFLNRVSDRSRALEIGRDRGLDPDRPWLGVNVTPYIDSWLKSSERVSRRSDFLDLMAAGLQSAVKEIEEQQGRSPEVVLFSCSPMDEVYSEELAAKVSGVVIDNRRLLSHDIQALMRECELLVGMRFHSLILASSVGVPIVGLVYAPKVRGYLRYLGCQELALELADLDARSLHAAVLDGWLRRDIIRQKQQLVVEELRRGAEDAARRVCARYYANHVSTAKQAAA